MGKPVSTYGDGDVEQMTFIVTQACNLACKYCFVTHKNNAGKMSFDVGRRAVDFLLNEPFRANKAVWDFIGGEPLLEIGLIDALSDYIKVTSYKRGHRWSQDYRIMVTSNGLLYSDPAVQRFVGKNKGVLSMGITIDGHEAKQDLNRVYSDGRGSYRDVIANVLLWLEQFPDAATKVTFASEDLPMLKDAIVHLFGLGMKIVPANVVFEDVWRPGDDAIFEEQLRELADHIIDNDLWREYNCTLFSESIGVPQDAQASSWCGAGKSMITVDHQGLLYPCYRFLPFSLDGSNPPYVVGNIYDGIDYNRLQPFRVADVRSQSDPKCLECEVASGCAWCSGHDYDVAPLPTIFRRDTAVCRMHQARVRANQYYWHKLESAKKIKRFTGLGFQHRKFLYILASDDAVPFCEYSSSGDRSHSISEDTLSAALDMCKKHFFSPVIVQPRLDGRVEFVGNDSVDVTNIASVSGSDVRTGDIIVYQGGEMPRSSEIGILTLDRADLSKLAAWASDILPVTGRLNLFVVDKGGLTEEELSVYEEQLRRVALNLRNLIQQGLRREMNVLTDSAYLNHPEDCGAGRDSMTLAPDGRLYPCPAFYFHRPEFCLGEIREFPSHEQAISESCARCKSPSCRDCTALACTRCPFGNVQHTLHLNVPTETRCFANAVEARVSKWLREQLAGPVAPAAIEATNVPEVESVFADGPRGGR